MLQTFFKFFFENMLFVFKLLLMKLNQSIG